MKDAKKNTEFRGAEYINGKKGIAWEKKGDPCWKTLSPPALNTPVGNTRNTDMSVQQYNPPWVYKACYWTLAYSVSITLISFLFALPLYNVLVSHVFCSVFFYIFQIVSSQIYEIFFYFIFSIATLVTYLLNIAVGSVERFQRK